MGIRHSAGAAVRLALLGATALTGLGWSAQALAAEPGDTAAVQEAPAADGQDDAERQEIIVTGSRIAQNGNNSPTPVTMVSTEELQATTPTSIPDALVKLPQFNQGQNTPNNSVNSNGRGFGAPGNFLNLRNLSPIRTLILQDGLRVPGTFYDQTVDTNMLPQLLIQRVDVVTGGASSVYGSDAVTGVVNFITDTKFNGLKGLIQTGISRYSDAQSVRAGVAFGTNIGERGHFEASVEYYNRDGVNDTGTRPYGQLYPVIVGAGTAAAPYRTILNGKQSNVAPGGLAVTGPFAGQQFLNDGSLAAFNRGQATETTNLSIGGDGGRVEHEDLLFSHRTAQAFARFDYELADNVKFFVQGRYATVHDNGASQIYTNVSNASASSPLNTGGAYPLWIYSGNAFLTQAQQTALTNSNTASFALNRMDNDLMRQLALDLDLRTSAVTVGFNGTLGAGDLAWDVHYTRGDNRTRYTTINNVNSAKFFAAVDAVRDGNNNIVCRSTIVSPGAFPGCQPLNLFGQNRASQGALDFIFDDTSWTAKNSMDDFGANLTGTAFEGWAGPIKFAVGGQYRKQKLDVTSTNPDTTFVPTNLRLGPAGNSLAASYPAGNLRYFKEVQAPGNGTANIYEANIETNVPLLRGIPVIELLSFNGAFRYAKYEVKGNGKFSNDFASKTWKLGLEWTVVDGLRFRGSRSRDFRAPTLWELYQTQIISASGVTDPLTQTAGSVNTVAGGNPNLTPEIGDNLTVGAVLAPKFLPGFSVSADYFKIRLSNAIGGINGLNAQVQALCLASDGSSPYCALVQRPISYNNTTPANYPTLIYNLSQNTVRTDAEGLDVELNYRTSLGSLGSLALRALYSNQWKLISTTFPGAAAINTSGTQTVPKHKITTTVGYQIGDLSIDWMWRYYSAVKFDANPAIIYATPKVGAYTQSDVNIALDFVKTDTSTATVFLNVNNLFDARGDIFQDRGYTGSPGLRYPTLNYADLLGRYYTAGIRFRF